MILSLDQALHITGYSILTIDGKLVTYGIIKSSTKDDFQTRLKFICEQIEILLTRYDIDVVTLESVTLQSNPQTLIKLAMLLGYIVSYLDMKSIPNLVINTSKWRSYLTSNVKLPYHNKGRLKRVELKTMSKLFVEREYAITVSDDIADAIVQGRYYLESMGGD